MKNIMVIFDSGDTASITKNSRIKSDFLNLLTKNYVFFKKEDNQIVLNKYTFYFFDIRKRNIDKFMDKVQYVNHIFYLIGKLDMTNLNKINHLISPNTELPTMGLQINEHDLFKIITNDKISKNVYIISHQDKQYSKISILDYQQNERHFEDEKSVQNEIIRRAEIRLKEYVQKMNEEQEFLADFKMTHNIMNFEFNYTSFEKQ